MRANDSVAPPRRSAGAMSDDEDFSDGIGASEEDHDVSDSDGDGAEAPQAGATRLHASSLCASRGSDTRNCRRTAAHKRTDKRDAAARRTATPFGAGGAKFAEAVAKLLASGGDEPVRALPRCMRHSTHPADEATASSLRPALPQAPTKQAAAATQGRARAAQVPILSRSRTVTKRVEDEHAERLRLRAVRRHKREVRLRRVSGAESTAAHCCPPFTVEIGGACEADAAGCGPGR